MQHYEKKWASRDLQRIETLRDFARVNGSTGEPEACPPFVHAESVQYALDKARGSRQLDSSGICLASVRLLFRVFPLHVINALAAFITSFAHIQGELINASVFGKEGCTPRVEAVRMILPLTALLTLCDIIVSRELARMIGERFPVPEFIYLGCTVGSQCLDVAYAAQLVIEKALDSKSAGAVATADIRAYYDSLDCFLIAKFLIEAGLDRVLVAAALALQLGPAVCVCVCVCVWVHSALMCPRQGVSNRESNRGGLRPCSSR